MTELNLNKLAQLSLDDNEFRGLQTKLDKFWTEHAKTHNQVKTEQHRLMWSRASPALNELLSICREIDSEMLFNKLVVFCVLMSGLGSPRSEAVVKETYPALQSVVKKTDVMKLTDLGRLDREQHLLELVQIVMGIRLFNKDCCKGGEGIDDLPELLTRAVQASKLQHENSSQSIRNRIERLTLILKIIYKIQDGGQEFAPNVNDLHKMKSALCLFWTQHFYLKDLLIELNLSEQNITSCVDQLRQTLVQLHETVRYRAAIPTIQVYPLFVQLSLVWRELQCEAAVLSHFSQILKAVASIADDFEVPFERIAAIKTPLTDFQAALNAFCPWTCVQTDGMLLAGNHKDENFTFRSPEAAANWFKDSSASYKLQKIIQTFPELKRFFEIDSEISMEPIKAETHVMTAEAQVQTEIHPIESNIDKNYTWSEWERKKQCVNLAKIAEKCTKSQQTVNSCFRVNKQC